jgi:prepilin-type N-terminal cleavage/methylation domain-containing protein/prepilin-type processing-associated H-X9-DG protein
MKGRPANHDRAVPRLVPGMTLLELLVVIAIISVLAALLAAVLGDAIGAAESLRCRDQLRQIGAAYRQYQNDSGGVWPPILTSDPRDVPAAAFREIEAASGLKMAPARPDPRWGQPGPHWSIVLWPYLHSIEIYTCPSDPGAGRRGDDVAGPAKLHSAALLDAPPESYALNVILFRTDDATRRKVGCTWGTAGDVDFSGIGVCTTRQEQRRVFPALEQRILFFCGASGQTVGSQYNVAYRTSGQVDRWDWHPHRASAAFADEPGCGSNYLFADGHAEYRDELPGLWEWGYDLGR